MSQPRTFNPYGMIGAYMKPGLDAIAAALPNPATATPDQLVTEVYNYISATFFSAPISRTTEIQIKSVAYNVINSVRSGLVMAGNAMYNESQGIFIETLIGFTMTSNLPSGSFVDRVDDIEDNIGISDLTVGEQTPLFLATTVGKASYDYFKAELGDPTSDWKLYFSTNDGENYSNQLYWSVEAMNGALAGYGATPRGLIAPTTDIVTVSQISALIGALTAAAGKVMFKWIVRITRVDAGEVSGIPVGGGGLVDADGTIRLSIVIRWPHRTDNPNRSKCKTRLDLCTVP